MNGTEDSNVESSDTGSSDTGKSDVGSFRRIALRILVPLFAAFFAILAVEAPASATVFWGCPAGTGCIFKGGNGTGDKLVVSVGSFGVGICHDGGPVGWSNNVSSGTADYGNGLQLMLFDNNNCTSVHPNTFNLIPSHSYNFSSGVNLYWNDRTSSFKIVNP